jgi:hypothetical protein
MEEELRWLAEECPLLLVAMSGFPTRQDSSVGRVVCSLERRDEKSRNPRLVWHESLAQHRSRGGHWGSPTEEQEGKKQEDKTL